MLFTIALVISLVANFYLAYIAYRDRASTYVDRAEAAFKIYIERFGWKQIFKNLKIVGTMGVDFVKGLLVSLLHIGVAALLPFAIVVGTIAVMVKEVHQDQE